MYVLFRDKIHIFFSSNRNLNNFEAFFKSGLRIRVELIRIRFYALRKKPDPDPTECKFYYEGQCSLNISTLI